MSLSPSETHAPTVSVVVPNYNHAKYLPQRMESILRQTYSDFEIIILDDASSDDSLAVIQNYLSIPEVRFVPNTQNSGTTFAQWNKGVDLARGEYVWIAESDDFAEPGLLEKLVPILENNPNVGISYGQSRMVDQNGMEVMDTLARILEPLDPQRWNSSFVASGIEECRRYLLWLNTIPNASAVLFRKQTFLDAGKADSSFKLTGDWFMWVKMLLISDLGFHSGFVNSFRQHGATVREQQGWDGLQKEKVRIQLEILKKSGLDRETKKRLVLQKVNELLQKYRNERPVRLKSIASVICRLWPIYALDPIYFLKLLVARHRAPELKDFAIR
jgi:glycosyltransferase involved in cell wall biosynthesis